MSNTNVNSFSRLLKYVSMALTFSLLGFVFGQMFIPPQIASMGSMFLGLFFLISFIASLFMKNGRFSNLKLRSVYIFAFIHGICIYPVINYYAYSLGVSTVGGTFIGTIAVFYFLSLYAKNKDISNILKFGTLLAFILLGIVISSFINIFLKSEGFNLVISAVSIVLFSLYIVYTVTQFKHALNYRAFNHKDDFAPFVLNLYTDFMNLFLNILSFLDSNDRD